MDIKDPSFNYDRFGQNYAGHRMTDARIAAYVNQALSFANSIINVGAGTGSYEPLDKYVISVEPSEVMRAQRINNGRPPAVIAKADALPFDNDSFDASMAMVTVHHWPDMEKGLLELKRVTRHQVLIMTFDPDALNDFWNAAYFPEVIAVEKARYPTIQFLTDVLGGDAEVIKIPIPLDCTDGFQEAFYGRPEAFLEKAVRQSQSAWGFITDEKQSELVKRLQDDLSSGEWDNKYGHFRTKPEFTGALRLVISRYN